MNDDQQSSIIQLSDRVASLVERLAQAQVALESALGDQVDAIINPHSATPILLSRAQQTLRESETRYRRLVGRMSAIIFELEPDGRTLFVNSAVQTITGYSPEVLHGQNWWETFFRGPKRRQADGLLRELRAGDVSNLEMPLTVRDGSTVILEVNSANEYGEDGSLQRILGFGIDITERKQAERLLRDSQEQLRLALQQTEEERNKLRALLDSMTEEVWFIDAAGRLSLLNETAVLGLNIGEVENRSLDDVLASLEVRLPDGSERLPEDAPLHRSLHRGEVIRNHEERVARLESGEERIRLANTAPVYGPDGQIIGAVATVRDITERERYRQQEELLYREQEARRAAEEANEFKTRLLGMVSHELRTPLTSILGFASTLLAEDVEWDADSRQDFLETIVYESKKLEELVDQLLQASRLEAGRLSVHPENIHFATILAVAQTQFGSLAANHRLVIEMQPDLPPVHADPRRVAQVLTNLLKNATQHAPAGSLVKIRAHQQGPYLQVDVSDEGPGIPADAHELVFEAFSQLQGRDRAKGAGLGLAICKGIVEAHSGRIWVQPGAARGTTVSFTLPVVGQG